MASLTPNEIRGLMEAYSDVYAPLEEEMQVEELAVEMIENASYVLFSQGYGVEDVISYFEEATEETIIEDYVNFAEENIIIESVAVSDEYIAEQFEILNEGLLDSGAKLLRGGVQRVLGAGAGSMKGGAGIRGAIGAMGKSAYRAATQTGSKLLSKGAQAAKGLVSKAGGALGKVGGALSKIPGAKAAGKLVGRAAPGVGAALYGMDAVSRAKKGDWGGAALSGLGAGLSLAPGVGTLASLAPAGVQMATDAMGLTGDKSKKGPSAKTAPSAKFNASKALGGQAAFKAGGGAAAMKKNPSLSAADVQKAGNQALFKAGGGSAAMTQKGQTRAQVIGQGSKNVAAPAPKAAPAAAPEVKATNTIAAKPTQPAVKPSTTPATKPATGTLGKTSFERRTPTSAELKAAQAARAGGETNPERVLQAAQEAGKREKQKTDIEKLKSNPSPNLNLNHYEYDAFDVVLEYLIDNGHAETVTEAAYIMTEMDAETIGDIVEAKYGTKEGRKALAKKIRAGKNIGKKGPGTGFKAVEKAAEKGGAEDPEAVAAAQMWKTYGKKGKGKTQKEW